MKNKSGIIWSYIFFIMLAGCGTHQQLAGKAPVTALDTSRASAPVSSGIETETGSEPSLNSEEETGYRTRPVEIKIEGGRPYLPVGAEFISKDGKVDLGEVIKALAEHKGFSVSWTDDVDQGKVVDCYTKAADNFYDALDNILRQLDYFYEIEGNTIVVRYKETKNYHLAMPDFSETLETSLGGDMLPSKEKDTTGMKAVAELENKSKEFNFWDRLETTLGSMVKCDGCPPPVIDRTTGTITISASKRIHRDVEAYLSRLKEESYKQVVIEAKIIEVALTERSATGIDWEGVFSGPELSGKTIGGIADLGDSSGYLWQKDLKWNSLLSGITISDVTWDVVVSAFGRYGDTRILADPKVHILNGRGAVLNAGQVRTYLESCDVTTSTETNAIELEAKTKTFTEGLSIGIKANILNDKEVVLYVFPAVARLVELRDVFESLCGLIQAPEVAVRTMSTYANVKDGDILVIGGLIQDVKGNTTKKVPVLGDLPYLGSFFTYEEVDNNTSELVILIKPRIITSE